MTLVMAIKLRRFDLALMRVIEPTAAMVLSLRRWKAQGGLPVCWGGRRSKRTRDADRGVES